MPHLGRPEGQLQTFVCLLSILAEIWTERGSFEQEVVKPDSSKETIKHVQCCEQATFQKGTQPGIS